MKKTTKPAAKAVATKRPRTYKKADLPRTARAYLGKVYEVHMDKENEAVARLIELHAESKAQTKRFSEELQETKHFSEELQAMRRAELEAGYAKAQAEREAHMEMLFPYPPKNIPLTLREKFLSWIGAR
jgi:hypothetical protein